VTDTTRFSTATGWQPRTSPQQGIEQLNEWLEKSIPISRERDFSVAVSQ
jgi:nucleoside-diphosphate-sugar epimerase